MMLIMCRGETEDEDEEEEGWLVAFEYEFHRVNIEDQINMCLSDSQCRR